MKFEKLGQSGRAHRRGGLGLGGMVWLKPLCSCLSVLMVR